MWWPFGKIIKIKCPDGTERLIYKNPEEAFPFFAKDWSAKFDSMLKATQELQGKLGASFENHINGFFTQLDQANRNMQISLRASYVVYTINPCENDKWLAREVHKTIENENFLRRIQYEIDFISCLLSNNAPPEAVAKAIENSTGKLKKPELEDKTSGAFKKANKDVLAWEVDRNDEN